MGELLGAEYFKSEANITRLIKTYRSADTLETEDVLFLPRPFKLLKFNALLDDPSYTAELLAELKCLELRRKSNDLYSLWQTADLQNVDLPCIDKFITFLKNSFSPLLSKIMGIKFSDKLSVTASLYKPGDHLLCHDDKCEDRSVAFVYYLTESHEAHTGDLELFTSSSDGQPDHVVKSLPPSANSIVCFEVTNYSYHQVAEVKAPGFERWSVNGWFHSDSALRRESLNYVDPLPKLNKQIKMDGLMMLDEFLNMEYCTPTNIQQCQKFVEEESFLMLKNFFNKKYFTSCKEALKSKSLKWKVKGPANRRKYEVANIAKFKDPLRHLIRLLMSPLFVSYLRNITGLSLVPVTDDQPVGTMFLLEVQRWKAGCYTMATDNDSFFTKPGLDLFFFFNSDGIKSDASGCGCITYLSSSDEDDDHELITIEPLDNAMYIVYRTEETVRFTKYITSDIFNEYHVICATYYEPE